MATDSIQPNYSPRRIHSQISGKLHKGHGIVAASASIPSKYQTIVTDNSDKKGFNSKAKRFASDYYMSDAPGPGNYQCMHHEIEKISSSFSKKGTGSFASKVKDSSIAKNSLITAQAAFKSKSKREPIQAGQTRIPSPSHYNVQDKVTRPVSKGPVSCFKSTTKRNTIDVLSKVPGPGAYKPFEDVTQPDKLVLPRKHYLCISAPAMPLPPPVEIPGPGTYEVVDYEGPPKHYMSSSVFVSNTSRWSLGHNPGRDNPGPATYRPERVGKQSFIYNSSNKWIPL